MSFRFSLQQLDDAAATLLHWMEEQGATVVALHGPMGAGKTTLTNALLRRLGSHDHGASPTFSIINEYALPDGGRLYHMDWYRLKDEEEAIAAGVEDLLDSGDFCLVEWPEKAAALLPWDTLHVRLNVVDQEIRELQLQNEQ